MNLQQYIEHPEKLDRTSLYELRVLTAQYPYFQPARLLLLKNLYLLHDSSFDEELRRAAMYIADRRRLFDLVEAAHYKIQKEKTADDNAAEKEETEEKHEDRTSKLIDDFLGQIPDSGEKEKKEKRKPTAADAHDYASYLLSTVTEDEKEEEESSEHQMKGQDLIDNFLNIDDGKMELKDEPEYEPEIDDSSQDDDTGYFTETLAKIYIKQGRYSKALEIIRRLNLIYPKKNRYFADQIRFLEKLIINNKQK